MSLYALYKHISMPVSKKCAQAERAYARQEYNTCLFLTRQIGETLCREILSHNHLRYNRIDYASMIHTIRSHQLAPSWVYGALDDIRLKGNRAVHSITAGNASQASKHLRALLSVMGWALEDIANMNDVKLPRFELPDAEEEENEALKALRQKQEELTNQLEKSEEARKTYQEQLSQSSEPQTLLSDSFTSSYEQLDEKERQALSPQIKDFCSQPSSHEVVLFPDQTDNKFVWVKLDDFYGMVVAISPNRDTLILAFIDGFKECKHWSATHTIDIHPELGHIQVYPTNLPTDQTKITESLFGALDDQDLIACGVPPLLVPAVRAIEEQDILMTLNQHMHNSVVSALIGLSEGLSVEQAKQQAGLNTNVRQIDDTDYDLASHNSLTQRHIAQVDEETLDAILKAPMEQWRIFLHPSQQKAVEIQANGPVRVLGGAGTGKTVALLHRAVYLIRHVFTNDEQLLLTTYTSNLAQDIKSALASMLTEQEMKRVDVTNLHKVAKKLVSKQGLSIDVATTQQRQNAWQKAFVVAPKSLNLPRPFYQDEWQKIILPQDIHNANDYMKASRKGRGTHIHKFKRTQIWQVFQTYRDALNEMNVVEWDDLIQDAKILVEKHPEVSPWRALLSDEVQDYTACELKFLRALVPKASNDMFLVGDSHQRIYGKPASFKSCGVHIVGRSFRLKINYRTTETIRELAMQALKQHAWDDMDGLENTLSGYRSLRRGVVPEISSHQSIYDELTHVTERIKTWALEEDVQLHDICIAARFGKTRDRFQTHLNKHHIESTVLNSNTALDELPPGVRLSTFHRLKGLEFKRLILVGINEGSVPWVRNDADFADNVAKQEHLRTECALFYVAATRARDHLVITSSSTISTLVQKD